MEQKFDSIEDEIVHVLTVHGSRMTALDIFADCGMAEDERAVANALYRMKQAGKVVTDGKIGTKNLYRLPGVADPEPVRTPFVDPDLTVKIDPSSITGSMLTDCMPQRPKKPEAVPEPEVAPRVQANWWISRNLDVKIEMPDGRVFVLDSDDAIELADAISKANEA